jgi:hypothetical protein
MGTGRARRQGRRMRITLAFRNVATIALLLGGVLVFGLGWFAGVALLWTSPTWRAREKVLATLVVPGGLPMAVVIAVFGVPVTDAVRVPGLVAVLQIALLAGPIAVAALLARQAFATPRRSGALTSSLRTPVADRP